MCRGEVIINLLNIEWLLYLQCVLFPCINMWFTFFNFTIVVYFKLILFVLFFFFFHKKLWNSWLNIIYNLSIIVMPGFCKVFSIFVLTLWHQLHTRWKPLPGKFPSICVLSIILLLQGRWCQIISMSVLKALLSLLCCFMYWLSIKLSDFWVNVHLIIQDGFCGHP